MATNPQERYLTNQLHIERLKAGDLRAEVGAKEEDAHRARMAAIHARAAATLESGGDAKLRIDNAHLAKELEKTRGAEAALLREAQQFRDENVKLMESVKKKEELILEWMHSNEAFKKLARKYGKELGVSDEQRGNDYQECILDVAEEDKSFDKTALVTSVRKKQ